MTGRTGDWICLPSGGRFWPLDPHPEDIFIGDIAHNLSMQCRYGGAVSRFYSVAEHSVILSCAVAPEFALAALMHDAGEYVLPDMVRPTKRQFPAYSAAEECVRETIFRKYAIPFDLPAQVLEFDDRICADEKAALLPPIPWRHNPDPLGVKIEGLAPNMARWRFFERFCQLFPVTWNDRVRFHALLLARRPTVSELISLSREHEMTPEEVAAQRESFARANVSTGDPRFD